MPQDTFDAKSVFFDLLDLPEDERESFIARACGGDEGKEKRVRSLLGAHLAAGDFLTEPASQKLSIDMGGGALQVDCKPGDMVDNYRLVRVIGEGGFGVVYLAEQERPVVRPVAIKIVKLGMDTKHVIARFEAERQALAMMDHPNIATVLDAGATETGRPYFVMEYVDGLPVTKYCDQHKLGVQDRLGVFNLVCQAVQHAHQKGVIHRDIKPNNVMVSVVDGRPTPKVIDFGVAKAMGSKLTERTLVTQDRHVVGTPQYMAPEQAAISGGDVDTRTDVYSLGVLLYELLTGTLPFEKTKLRGAGLAELERIIREDRPRRPSATISGSQGRRDRIAGLRSTDCSRLRKDLGGDLDWIVMRALEKDRSRRYPTCNALAADVVRHLECQPVDAGPPGTWYRLMKLWQRRRVAMAAISLAVLSLVIAAVGTTWFGVIAWRARDSALEANNEASRLQRIAEVQSYVANVFAAEGALRTNDSASARRRLDAAPAALRGWEWRHFDQQIEQSKLTYNPTEGRASFVEISPDGLLVATSWPDFSVRLAELATGKELHVFQGGAICYNALFSPDSRLLYSADTAGSIYKWDVESGVLLDQWEGHEGRVASIALSSDGSVLYSSGAGGKLRTWSTEDGESTVLFDLEGVAVSQLTLALDGRRLAATAWDQRLRIFDTQSGEVVASTYCSFPETEIQEPVGYPLARIMAIDASPDGRVIYAGTADGRLTAWDADDGSFINEPAEFGSLVRSIDSSRDGRFVAAAGWDGTVWVWATPDFAHLATVRGHDSDVRQAVFTPDSKMIVTASLDNTVRLWDAATGIERATLRGHEHSVYGVDVSPGGETVATYSEDGTVRLWDIGQRSLDVLSIEGSHVLGTEFGPGPDQILVGPRQGPASVQDLNTGEVIHEFDEGGDRVLCVISSPDGSVIAVSHNEPYVSLWDAKSGRKIRQLDGHTGDIWEVAFSPDGKELGSASRDRTAKIWNVQTGQIKHDFGPFEGRVLDLAFASGGEILVLGTDAGELWLLSTMTGELIADLDGQTEGSVRAMAASPDGAFVAVGTGGRAIHVLDVAKREIVQTMYGHGSSVVTLAWMPDGSRIVSGSADRTVRLWDPVLGENVGMFLGHTNIVRDVSVSPDGRLILSGAEDNTVRAWRAPAGEG